MQGEFKNKFVFIDFFMENCPWCYYMVDDFNRIMDDMIEWYGEDNVAFIREELENFIRIESMPSVIIKNIKDIFPDDVISLILVYCTGSVVETIQNKANAQIRHEIKHTV